MIDESLLKILVCPETKQPLHVASAELLARLNQAIGSAVVVTRGGAPVSGPLEAGLVREDEAVLYPIRDDIPIMLIDEAILLTPLTP